MDVYSYHCCCCCCYYYFSCWVLRMLLKFLWIFFFFYMCLGFVFIFLRFVSNDLGKWWEDSFKSLNYHNYCIETWILSMNGYTFRVTMKLWNGSRSWDLWFLMNLITRRQIYRRILPCFCLMNILFKKFYRLINNQLLLCMIFVS